MDIGEQKRVIQVEPEPLEIPAGEPTEDRPVPVREPEPEKVPARQGGRVSVAPTGHAVGVGIWGGDKE